ncbi:MAG: DUF3189 family protein [Syntrophomonadaceae bacterium]
MNIIFLGTIGIYHPVLAAHLYLGGQWADDHSRLAGWGDFSLEARGVPILVGRDSFGNQVYALGAGVEVAMTRKTIEQLIEVLGHSPDEVLIHTISVGPEKVLLFLYRAGSVRMLQNPINTVVSRLLRHEYPWLRKQVEEFKAKARFS